MSYVDKHLMTGEQVMYRTRRHWVVFLSPLLLVLAGLVLGVWGWTQPPEGQQRFGLGTVLMIAGGLLIVFGVLKFLPRLVDFATSEFAVTNRRVIVKVGWIQRRSIETL